MKKVVVLRIGGSLIGAPARNERNKKNIRTLIDFVNEHREYKFVITNGGGPEAREYISVAKELNPLVDSDSLDWIGIRAIMIIAQALATGFGKHSQLLDHEPTTGDVEKFLKSEERVLFAPAAEPGGSSNWAAVKRAISFGAEGVINVGVRALYDDNPDINKSAQLIPCITWDEVLEGSPRREPGAHYPFDRKASELAKDKRLWVKLVEGLDPKNLQRAIEGEDFRGTLIT